MTKEDRKRQRKGLTRGPKTVEQGMDVFTILIVIVSQIHTYIHIQPAISGDVRDASSIPRSGRSLGRGNGNPVQYSCLENPMDRRAWRAIVHRVTKNWVRLKWLSRHAYTKHKSKLLAYIISFHLLNRFVKYVSLCLFCQWRNWALERRNSFKDTQQMCK